tara:strand:+ start:492 stop:671 length:180 start_codon:yes stop_codon:yes gene_type:complete
MKLDLGATTFDLQDTEFRDPLTLFDRIRLSDSRPYREERELARDMQEMWDSVRQHHTLK